MKWIPRSAEISIVFGKLTDRWFVIQKPHKWSLDKSSDAASVATTLSSFIPGGKLWFPFPMGRELAGLTLVATDLPMCQTLSKSSSIFSSKKFSFTSKFWKNQKISTLGAFNWKGFHMIQKFRKLYSTISYFESMYKNGQIGFKYRCLLDVSRPPNPIRRIYSRRLNDSPFSLLQDKIKQSGSVWKDDGTFLKQDGILKANIQSASFRYSLKCTNSNGDNFPDVSELQEEFKNISSLGKAKKNESYLTKFNNSYNSLQKLSPSRFRRFYQNESHPTTFNNTLSKNILGKICEASYSEMAIPASLSFELKSIAKHNFFQDRETSTALYHVCLQTAATHQLRLQFYEAGCPVFGDYLYHPHFNKWLFDDIFLFDDPQKRDQSSYPNDPFGFENDSSESTSNYPNSINTSKSIPELSNKSEAFGDSGSIFTPSQSLSSSKKKSSHISKRADYPIYIQTYQISFRDPLDPHYGKFYQFELTYPPEWRLIHDI